MHAELILLSTSASLSYTQYQLCVLHRVLKGVIAQSCVILCDPTDLAHQAPLSMESSGKNTGVGCHSFLQGIFSI